MLVTKLEKVDCVVSGEKEIKVNNKGSEHFWNFTLSTKSNTPQMVLRNVALINDANRHHFSLASVKHCGRISNRDDASSDSTQKTEDVIKTDSLESTPTQQQVKFILVFNKKGLASNNFSEKRRSFVNRKLLTYMVAQIRKVFSADFFTYMTVLFIIFFIAIRYHPCKS